MFGKRVRKHGRKRLIQLRLWAGSLEAPPQEPDTARAGPLDWTETSLSKSTFLGHSVDPASSQHATGMTYLWTLLLFGTIAIWMPYDKTSVDQHWSTKTKSVELWVRAWFKNCISLGLSWQVCSEIQTRRKKATQGCTVCTVCSKIFWHCKFAIIEAVYQCHKVKECKRKARSIEYLIC